MLVVSGSQAPWPHLACIPGLTMARGSWWRVGELGGVGVLVRIGDLVGVGVLVGVGSLVGVGVLVRVG